VWSTRTLAPGAVQSLKLLANSVTLRAAKLVPAKAGSGNPEGECDYTGKQARFSRSRGEQDGATAGQSPRRRVAGLWGCRKG
jgi:hypothetical protein